MSTARSGARIGLGTVLVATLLTLFVGFAHKSLCLTVEERFDTQVQRLYCYTDFIPLYGGRDLAQGDVPYLDANNEYPVGTALFMWTTARLGRDHRDFFLVNALVLSGVVLLTSWTLYRAVGSRALYFALSPLLGLYAFLNWDVLPVALATAATLAFLGRFDTKAGVFVGIGVATKLYPILLLPPFAFERVREGGVGRAVRLAVAAVIAWGVVNLPFMILALDRWSEVFRFSASRAVHWATLWFVGCRALTGELECAYVRLVNVASVAAFLAGAIWVWRAKVAREPNVPRWTLGFPLLILFLLTSKVYSPQYSLWLLPWFALVLPNLRLYMAFTAADLATFISEFSWLERHFGDGDGGLPLWPLEVAVVLRAAILVAMLAAFVRRPVGPRAAPTGLAGAGAA